GQLAFVAITQTQRVEADRLLLGERSISRGGWRRTEDGPPPRQRTRLSGCFLRRSQCVESKRHGVEASDQTRVERWSGMILGISPGEDRGIAGDKTGS